MTTVTLYRVVTDGKTTVTPVEPESYDSTLYRLIADEGKELVKGDVRTCCIDTDSADGWTEEDAQITPETADDAIAQLNEIREVYADEI